VLQVGFTEVNIMGQGIECQLYAMAATVKATDWWTSMPLLKLIGLVNQDSLL